MSERVLFLGAAVIAGLAALPKGQRGRGALAFAAGGVFAHWGWCLHQLPLAIQDPTLWLDLRAGFAASFLPLGALLLSARERSPTLQWLASLPLVLALARLGCRSAGCCQPNAGAESIAGAALFLALLTQRDELRAGLGVAGLALIRLVAEPFRGIPPLGPPWLPACWPPVVCLGIGLSIAFRSLSVPRGRSCPASTCSERPSRSASS